MADVPSFNPAGHPTAPPKQRPPHEVVRHRDTFWQNVVRETLMAMSVAAGSGGRISPTPTAAATSADPVGDLFDGRMAIVTRGGLRIAIGDIYPLFAVSTPGNAEERMLSADVQCTVFHVKTPGGESYTLPISEISMVHSLSDELVRKLEGAAEASSGASADGADANTPFGFAAFTSLVRDQQNAAAEGEQDSE